MSDFPLLYYGYSAGREFKFIHDQKIPFSILKT